MSKDDAAIEALRQAHQRNLAEQRARAIRQQQQADALARARKVKPKGQG